MDDLEGLVLSDGAAFTEGLANIFIVAQLLSLLLVVVLLGSACHAYLCGTVQRRRAFRCPLMQREVEVEFSSAGSSASAAPPLRHAARRSRRAARSNAVAAAPTAPSALSGSTRSRWAAEPNGRSPPPHRRSR